MQVEPSSHVLNLPATGTMAQVVARALREADEIAVAVAFVMMSGLQRLLPALNAASARGARVRVLTSTYLNTTEPQALRSLRLTPGIELRLQDGPDGFHAKAHLFVWGQRREVWVGSSNWSRGGLASNVEWNLRVDDAAALDEAWRRFEGLWRRPDVHVLDEILLARYAASWRAGRLPAGPALSRVAESTSGYLPAPVPSALQSDALQRLQEQRTSGVTRALVVAATGVGKTLLAAFDAYSLGARRLLFVAHRKDIVQQAALAFTRVFGSSFAPEVLIEGAMPRGSDAVFVTVQALFGSRGRPLLDREWDYVVIDEFHHAEADGWKRVLHALRTRFLLGLTATPERADGRNVMDLCDGNVAFEVRLPEAIRQGALIPFHYFGIADETVDYGRIPRRVGEEALGAMLSVATRAELVLHHAVQKGYVGLKRVAVGFCAGVAHAMFMRESFRALGQHAEVALGDTPLEERQANYRRLDDPLDPLEWLFVADVLNEGVDIPAINTIVFLRPTESPVVFLQQLGRGLRRHPHTDVLTVLDLVGLHRGAFDGLQALHDSHAVPSPESLHIARRLGVAVTPPEGCEFLLEDRTLAVLEKVRRMATPRRERVEDAYLELRATLGRAPQPLDGLRADALSLAEVRRTHGSWRALRIAMGDAEAWEQDLSGGEPADVLLSVAERNLQLPRVWGYAAVWSALTPDIAQGWEEFFRQQPRWRVEYKPLSSEELTDIVGTTLRSAGAEALFDGAAWTFPLHEALRDAVRQRLLAALEVDYRLRHGGVLRSPDALQRFAAYGRAEVVHHFGEQYDPAKHNRGVIASHRYPGHWILLARSDNRTAKAEHQYDNRLLDRQTVLWSSQNRMRPNNEAGGIVTRQEALGARLHLFWAASSHRPFRYLGEARVLEYSGGGPMSVRFALTEPLPDAVWEELTAASAVDDAVKTR